MPDRGQSLNGFGAIFPGSIAVSQANKERCLDCYRELASD